MKPRYWMQNSKVRSLLASEDSVLEGEDLLFSSREDHRGLDQFCAPEPVFLLVGESAGQNLLGHPPVQEAILHQRIGEAAQKGQDEAQDSRVLQFGKRDRARRVRGRRS